MRMRQQECKRPSIQTIKNRATEDSIRLLCSNIILFPQLFNNLLTQHFRIEQTHTPLRYALDTTPSTSQQFDPDHKTFLWIHTRQL
jgi:hypothetical protein